MDDITLEDDLVKKNFTYVRVLHNFRGSNNDELYMKRDDVSWSFSIFGNYSYFYSN